MRGPGVIILAAGTSSRMGRPKQLLPWNGRTLLRHTIEIALDTPLRPIVVVLGCEAEACQNELVDLDAIPVVNPRWREGMGTSVSFGVAMLEKQAPQTTGTLILLVDQPDVTSEFLKSMLSKWSMEDASIVATQYAHGGGVPAIFPRSYFEELRALNADRGARQIIAREPAILISPPAEFVDLDTPEDHQARVNPPAASL